MDNKFSAWKSSLEEYWRQAGSVYLLINAYLIYQIIHLLIQDKTRIFFELNAQANLVNFALAYVLLVFILLSLQKISPYPSDRWFKGLILLYLLILACLTPAILIQCACALVLFIILAQEKSLDSLMSKAIILGLLFLTGRIIYLSLTVDQTGLEKFALDLSDPFLIFQLKLALALGLCALLVRLYFKVKKEQSVKPLRTSQLVGLRVSTYMVIAGLTLCLCLWLVAREAAFSYGTFDKGIFSQMYANMAKGLGPVTTLERDRWLSHFAVHVSPIYYLILPVYRLWPQPETLEWLQVLLTMAAVIPFKRIVDRLNIPPLVQVLLPLLYAFAPLLTTGHMYGFHENCFLPLTLLWLLAALLEAKPWSAFLATLACLAVKEDAMIYLVSIGLYFAWEAGQKGQWKRVKWIVVGQILLPLLYFGLCLYFLSKYGDGTMVSRFSNFMLAGEKGLLAVVKNILLNPAYSLASLFTQAKLTYLLMILLSQAFLPVLHKGWHGYFLWIPLIVINLMSDYVYQVNPGFQYHYGSTTLLLFLSLRRLDQLSVGAKYKQVWTKTVIALIASLALWYQGSQGLWQVYHSYQQNQDRHQAVIQTLNKVNPQQKILAYSYYTTHLSQASYLYDIFYHDKGEVDPDIDVLVFPRQLLQADQQESETIRKYLAAGYYESPLSSDEVLIYQKPS